MRRHFLRFSVAAAVGLALAGTAQAQTDLWFGGFNDLNFSTPQNWVGGTVPTNNGNGTDTLLFTDVSSTFLNLDTAVNFAALQVYQSHTRIIGGGTLTIGAGGITLTSSGDFAPELDLFAPVVITSGQTWQGSYFSINNTITGTTGGSGPLALDNGYFSLNAAANTFGGGLSIGDYSILRLGASGFVQLGTGAVTMGDGSSLLIAPGSSVVNGNAITLGDGANGYQITLGGDPTTASPAQSILKFGGDVTVTPDLYSDVSLALNPNSTVILAGNLSASAPGVALHLSSTFSPTIFGSDSLMIVRGSISNLSAIDLGNAVSLILDGGSGPSQLTGPTTINTGTNTYLGLGNGYNTHVAAFLTSSVINQGTFSGTLGFDTTVGATDTFLDNIDLTNFNTTYGQFVGLGSATTAILSGTITPQGGAAAMYGTAYFFGGGGGTLFIQSAIVNSTHPAPNTLILSPGNAPLTLVLSGTTTYTGSTYIDGSALIFDAPFSSSILYLGEESSVGGYVGSTANAGYADSGTGPQSFINRVEASSVGVIGFDYFAPNSPRVITGQIDLSGFYYGPVYLGTATAVTFAGTIISGDNTFRFAGVKGGAVTVTSPSLTGANAVVIGAPQPMESFGSVSSVFLPTANSYTGGTTLNGGYLYVGNDLSLGTGDLAVPGPGNDGTGTIVGLAPSGGDITLANNLLVPFEGLHLNSASSPYTLTLTGQIGDIGPGPGNLVIDGPVVLAGSNSFGYGGSVDVQGTTLTVTNDYGVGGAWVNAAPGSTLTFTSANPQMNGLSLDGSTADFTFDGGAPEMFGFSMSGGSTVNFAANSTPVIFDFGSDDVGSGNTINLGNGSVLSIVLDADPDFHGVIAGGGGLAVIGGLLNLSGTNTYSGGTTIATGAAVIASNDSALGVGAVSVGGTLGVNRGITVANPLTLLPGGALAGYGTFSPGGSVIVHAGSSLIPGVATVTVNDGGNLAPAIGTLTFGGGTSLELGAGGLLNFSIADATGAAGNAYSLINVSGALVLSASAGGNEFSVNLFTFAPGTNSVDATQAINFNPALSYSWTLVSATGGITGFSSDAFVVDQTYFLNSTGIGQFFVSQSGNDLLLNFSPVPEPSSWVLMAAGLCAAGAVLRRRRRRS